MIYRNIQVIFDDLHRTLEYPKPAAIPRPSGNTRGGSEILEVFPIGSFEASFVPTIADFKRLDERFRLPVAVWDKLPSYQHYGFAVFKLKSGHQNIHPMAFRFSRRDPTKLFFPTVHIHDGQFHEQAMFSHNLYAQLGEQLGAKGWAESPGHAMRYVSIARSQGLVAGDQHVYHRTLFGNLPNEDTWLPVT